MCTSDRCPLDPEGPGRRAAFGIGMLHGIGAETPTQVVLFLSAASAAGALAGELLLLSFTLGLLASNTAIAIAATAGFLHAERRFGIYARGGGSRGCLQHRSRPPLRLRSRRAPADPHWLNTRAHDDLGMDPIDTVRRYAEAWKANDIPAVFDLSHDDFVLHYFGGSPLAGDHVGKDAAIRVLVEATRRSGRQLDEIEDVLGGSTFAAIVAREGVGNNAKRLVRRLFLYTVREASSPSAGCTKRTSTSSTRCGAHRHRGNDRRFHVRTVRSRHVAGRSPRRAGRAGSR